MLNFNLKSSAITRILRDMSKKNIMPLSWSDQEKRNNIKVLYPRHIIEKKIEVCDCYDTIFLNVLRL